MRIQLLGPVGISTGRTAVRLLRSAKSRHLLALLAWQPNAYLSDEQAIEEMWREGPPDHPRDALYTHASRLRRVLPRGPATEAPDGGCTLVRQDGGYILAVAPDAVDLHRFGRLVDAARAACGAARREEAFRLLEEALATASGTPLADLRSPWAERARRSVELKVLSARLSHARLALELGRHTETVPVLHQLALDHPLDEGIAETLMRALYLSGRQAEALACFRTIRDALVDQLGHEPGRPLQSLHEHVLRHDPALGGPAPRD
ncbi:AfsR/SARP family transcriptional regulator [Streptomyces sp. NPDC000410]|uniref:AfsR/SARP family transcriptional regulator n=1 Tax=Streptomyces sp. NPDC000410 TaxID=3154254 RepID=UPI00331F2C56